MPSVPPGHPGSDRLERAVGEAKTSPGQRSLEGSVVGGHESCHSLCRSLGNQPEQDRDTSCVEAVAGFVEHEQAWPAEQCAEQIGALALAEGECAQMPNSKNVVSVRSRTALPQLANKSRMNATIGASAERPAPVFPIVEVGAREHTRPKAGRDTVRLSSGESKRRCSPRRPE